MKNVKTFKRACSVVVAMSLLCGIMTVMGASLPQTVAETTQVKTFVADFSEVGKLLEGAAMKDSVDNTHYETAYTPIGDTSTPDGKINTWMRERFASTTNYKYSSTRAWFAQKSDEISDAEADGWGKNGKLTGFTLTTSGNLRLRVVNASGANMMRRVDTIIPQFNGENVQLKNFKMTVKYRTYLQDNRGALTVAFDETKAGYIPAEPNVYGELGYRRRVTGSTLVLGNGTGMEQAADKDGWIFYNKKNLISSTTVDEKHFADPSIAWRELKPGQDYTVENGDIVYKRFDTDSTQQWLTLTVEVKNGKATFTTTSEDGYRNETMEMDYTPNGGYVSIGMSNRDYVISYVDIEEYDENGNAVDFGTYHNSLKGVNGAVEVFEADFTDLPDVNYVEGQYLYNVNHDTATGKGVGLTATDTANATAVGAYTGTYTVDVKDKALVGYLESKFDFYTYANGGGGTFPMWNAAGYVVDADGNPLGSGFANSNPHNPSTGVAGGAYMPGSGLGGYWYGGMYPTMTLSGNKWFHIASDIGINAMNPFDVVYSYALNNANGDKAVVKNFQLDLDFKLTSPGESSYPHNQSPVFVKFGGYDSVKNGCTDGAMFAISHNGGYFLDDLNGGFTGSKNSDGSPAYTTYIGGAARTQIVEEAHLTLTVKNGAVTAVVTLADGTEVLNVTKNDISIQNGLIYIGTTYAGMNHGLPFFGGVRVVRLDDDGNPIDFTDGDKDTFEAHFVGLTEVVDTCYYRDLGTKNDAILTGKMPSENHWLTNAISVGSGYPFDANDTNIVKYLNEKFEFYHTDLTGKLHAMPTPYTTTEELQTDKWAPTAGRWVLFGGKRLRASLGVASSELFRKSLTLVPKTDGNAMVTADFEMEFDYSIESVRNGIYYPGGVALTFRSAEKAVSKDNAEAVTLVFTREQMVLYDNAAPDYNYADVLADEGALAWNDGITDVSAARVSLRVTGDKLSLKVTSTDGGTVYYENADIALSRLYDGYVYLTALNSDVAFGDLRITPSFADPYLAVPTGLTAQNGTIYGLDARFAYEYKKENTGVWVAVPQGSTEIPDLENASYQVRFAANDNHAASAAVEVQLCTYDRENTVQYDFEQSTQLNDFDTWFVPTITYGNTAIRTTDSGSFSVENGGLRFNGCEFWNDPTTYQAGVKIEGQTWKCSYASVYNSNTGVAVLKNKQYENFILDFDFTGSPYWTTVGFGAENTENGVFWTTENGGYSFFLESSGSKGGANFYYMTAEGLKTQNAPQYFKYDSTKQHHMRITVSGNKAYMSVDDQPAWVVDVPASYDGGYIFFALNNTASVIDNVQVVDLDAKEIVITDLAKPIETTVIDRAAGDSLHLPEVAYGLTAEGYEYPLLLEGEISEDYRSYKNGIFTATMRLKALHNLSADGLTFTASVENRVDYDATVSRKYYFDHPNDFEDFNAYYSEPIASEGYWANANDTGSDTEKNRKWSAYDGSLTAAHPTAKWCLNNGAVSVNYLADNGHSSPVARMRNLSTLMYKDHTLLNFRMEYDVKKGENSWWYNYAVIGVQDPTKYVYKLHKWSASLSTGENTSNERFDGTKDAGVYAFLEQEGYFNIFGNIQSGSDRVDADAVTVDGDAYTFIQNYDRNAWHHVTIEVVNGIMKWTVDDSFTLYYELDYNAYGGYVGIGSHATNSQFDNFQITALDANGNTVALDTAEQGGAKPKETIQKPNGWQPSFKFSWD